MMHNELFFIFIFIIVRYSKYVVREIMLSNHLLIKRRQTFFYLLFSPPRPLSYVSLVRYDHCTCPNGMNNERFFSIRKFVFKEI
jgi:hypothetical protein